VQCLTGLRCMDRFAPTTTMTFTAPVRRGRCLELAADSLAGFECIGHRNKMIRAAHRHHHHHAHSASAGEFG